LYKCSFTNETILNEINNGAEFQGSLRGLTFSSEGVTGDRGAGKVKMPIPQFKELSLCYEIKIPQEAEQYLPFFNNSVDGLSLGWMINADNPTFIGFDSQGVIDSGIQSRFNQFVKFEATIRVSDTIAEWNASLDGIALQRLTANFEGVAPFTFSLAALAGSHQHRGTLRNMELKYSIK
jgi:hypothetical protein